MGGPTGHNRTDCPPMQHPMGVWEENPHICGRNAAMPLPTNLPPPHVNRWFWGSRKHLRYKNSHIHPTNLNEKRPRNARSRYR